MPEEQNLETEFEEFDGEEYEEISGEEVDRVVDSLEQLIESVESENIKAFLDDALNNIYYLVHDEEEEEYEDDADEPLADAA